RPRAGGSTSAAAPIAATSAAATPRRRSMPATTPRPSGTRLSGASSRTRTGSTTTRPVSTSTVRSWRDLSITRQTSPRRDLPDASHRAGSACCTDGQGPGVASPQPGILALGTASHAYLELDLTSSVDPASAVARVASLREPRTTIGGVNLVAGFRPELWATVAPDASPPGLHGFKDPIVGPTGYTLPATQHDVVIWLTGASYDVVFDLTRDVVAALEDVADLGHEVVGWPYHHDRDLTGFIDGTENPTLVEATEVALIPPGSPGEAGSILLLQPWEHDVAAWEGLEVASQEAVIGRQKADSTELDPKPKASHVPRTAQEVV